MTRVVAHPEEAMQITNLHEIAKYPCTAHIPGYYPDLVCLQCKNYVPTSKKEKGRCAQHFIMRGQAYRFDEEHRDEDWWRGLPTIPGTTPACKYFEAAERIP